MLLFLQEEKEEIAAETQVTLAVAPHTLLQLLGELVRVTHSQDIDCGPKLPAPRGLFPSHKTLAEISTPVSSPPFQEH